VLNPNDTIIRLAGEMLNAHRHLCAFFDTPEEEVRVLAPFIVEGLDRGEKAFHIVDPAFVDGYIKLLEDEGIAVTAAMQTGQFEIATWHDAYLRTGGFDQFDTLQFIQDVLTQNRDQGFPLSRLVAHMEWSLTDNKGVGDLVEYESRLNDSLSSFDDPVLCVYDTTRFGAGVVMDILRTHPAAIVGEALHRNPFYVEPDEFLRELRGDVIRQSGD
jgi:hypothetical protein